jgi:uncharacterized protein (TIGR03067 family)
MATGLLGVMLAGLAVAADQPAGAVRAEKDKLKGIWALEAVRDGGIDAMDLKKDQWGGMKDLRVTFGADRVDIKSAAQPNGETQPYKLDPSKKPKELDIGGRGERRIECIYKLDGDKLIVAVPFYLELVAGGPFDAERQRHIRRPRDFKETKETAPPLILILRRVKR